MGFKNTLFWGQKGQNIGIVQIISQSMLFDNKNDKKHI